MVRRTKPTRWWQWQISNEGFPLWLKHQRLFDELACGNGQQMVILWESEKLRHLSSLLTKCHRITTGLTFFLPFFGRPLPFPSRDFLSSSLLLGLVGATAVPLTTSPLSLRESPLPESLEEFFLSLRLAFALRRASWMLLLDEDNQLPFISLLMFLLGPLLSSSPDAKESLRSSASVGLQGWMEEIFMLNYE